MDILRLILSREVKSRGRIFILYKSKPIVTTETHTWSH